MERAAHEQISPIQPQGERHANGLENGAKIPNPFVGIKEIP